MLIYISAVIILPPRLPPTLRRTTLIMLKSVNPNEPYLRKVSSTEPAGTVF